MLGQVVYKVNQTVLPCDLSPGKLTWRGDRGRCARILRQAEYEEGEGDGDPVERDTGKPWLAWAHVGETAFPLRGVVVCSLGPWKLLFLCLATADWGEEMKTSSPYTPSPISSTIFLGGSLLHFIFSKPRF